MVVPAQPEPTVARDSHCAMPPPSRTWSWRQASRQRVEDIVARLEQEEAEGHYRVLTRDVRTRVRHFYVAHLPAWARGSLDQPVMTLTGEVLARRAVRIVVGDHGAYVEMHADDIHRAALTVEPGQEWRLHRTNPYQKYVWWRTADGAKVYEQVHGVKYADYRAGMFYVDPHAVNGK